MPRCDLRGTLLGSNPQTTSKAWARASWGHHAGAWVGHRRCLDLPTRIAPASNPQPKRRKGRSLSIHFCPFLPFHARRVAIFLKWNRCSRATTTIAPMNVRPSVRRRHLRAPSASPARVSTLLVRFSVQTPPFPVKFPPPLMRTVLGASIPKCSARHRRRAETSQGNGGCSENLQKQS